MSDIIDVFKRLHEGHRQLCMAVLGDMEIDGNERRITKLRDLVKELDTKIQNMSERRRKWQKIIEDSEMLTEELDKYPNDGDEIKKLKSELSDRIKENQELLEKTALDGTQQKKVRIETAIEKLIGRRRFAAGMSRKLASSERGNNKPVTKKDNTDGMSKLGDFMPEKIKSIGVANGS